MAPDLFRVYFDPTEIGPDGYPFRWHHPIYKSDEMIDVLIPAIKDLVREQAGNRCVRCRHPYTGGGEWSPCDKQCTHRGPVRMRVAYLGERSPWVEHDLTHWGMNPWEAAQDDGPDGYRVQRHDVEAKWRVLTVHHLNGVKHDCRWWNLVALDQRCHLTIQGKVVMHRPWRSDHSAWFKPYVAGYYAWSILGEELSRDEVMGRLDELLELERTQHKLEGVDW